MYIVIWINNSDGLDLPVFIDSFGKIVTTMLKNNPQKKNNE